MSLRDGNKGTSRKARNQSLSKGIKDSHKIVKSSFKLISRITYKVVSVKGQL